MLGPQADQRAALRQISGGVRRGSPIDEERRDTIESRSGRIGQFKFEIREIRGQVI